MFCIDCGNRLEAKGMRCPECESSRAAEQEEIRQLRLGQGIRGRSGFTQGSSSFSGVVQPAGRLNRIMASCVDWCVLAVFIVVVSTLIAFLGVGALAGMASSRRMGNPATDAFLMFGGGFLMILGVLLGGFFLTFLLLSVLEASRFQGSPGKILMGLVVTDQQGERISILRALMRNLTKYGLPMGVTLLFGALAMGAAAGGNPGSSFVFIGVALFGNLAAYLSIYVRPLWHRYGEGLHDSMTGTIVQQARIPGLVANIIGAVAVMIILVVSIISAMDDRDKQKPRHFGSVPQFEMPSPSQRDSAF